MLEIHWEVNDFFLSFLLCGHVLMFVSSSAVYGRAVSNSFFVSQQWIANKYILVIIRKQYYSTSLRSVKITRKTSTNTARSLV